MRHALRAFWMAAGLTCGSVFQARAELRLPALFSDHLVLQAGTPVPVWGWASPGTAVSVVLGGERASARAGTDGRWQVRMGPLASAEALVLEVEARTEEPAAAAPERITVRDVRVGEVWLCAGQSNMAMSLGGARDAAAECAAADFSDLRVFTVRFASRATPAERCEGEWVVCSPRTARRLSAAAFFFGRALHRQLQSPVGLIVAAEGGTLIDTWISLDALATEPDFAPFAPLLAQPSLSPARLHKNVPGNLFNGMIQPLAPYALRGVVWYQGESDAFPPTAHRYAARLHLLVEDWRRLWDGALPFGWVQLPEFRVQDPAGRRQWPLVRDEQRRALRIPRTGMAVGLGLGDPDDIHPRNKQGVGQRLADWALADVYSIPGIVGSASLPRNIRFAGSAVTIEFDPADQPLTSAGEPVRGFECAAADRVWHPAQARIAGASTVVVSSTACPQPVAVRYAWADLPDATLAGAGGLPVPTFRSDDWPIEPPPRPDRTQGPIVELPILDAPPARLDGSLDEAPWRELPERALRDLRTGAEPSAPTFFRLFWSDDALFVGVRCLDPEPGALRIGTDRDGDSAIWNGDVVEILLETDAHAYYQIAINPAGAVVCIDRGFGIMIDGINRLWTAGAETVVRTDATGWSLECRIPVTPSDARPPSATLHGVIGRRPCLERPWHFNICRQRIREAGAETSAFSPSPGGFHAVEAFARLATSASPRRP